MRLGILFLVGGLVASCAHLPFGGSKTSEESKSAQAKSEPKTESASVKKSEAKSERLTAKMVPDFDPAAEVKRAELLAWCEELQTEAKRLGWKLPKCSIDHFVHAGKSVEGRPLVYAEFGNPEAKNNTTLILSMVHGDETTPLYVAIKLMEWLRENQESLHDKRVVLAPLVNPDGFYKKKKTRTNARGVDLNRNLPTGDWEKKAVSSWKRRYRSNSRRFPGWKANSEPETEFQIALLNQFKPDKILSLHAPLNFYDYDGPNVLTLKRFPAQYVKKCLELRSRLKAVSGGFFPGSLGNYAGQERGIPTITLELPTATARYAPKYWKKFKEGLKTVIQFEVPSHLANAGNRGVEDDVPRAID